MIVDASDREPLLHPVAIVAVAVLLLNDHLLKAAFPATWWTGKLSDFAGLAFFPLFLLALAERLRIIERATSRASWVAIALTAIVFTSIELLPFGELVYSYGLGALQYPFRAAMTLSIPQFSPVEAYADPTDCFALSALIVPAMITTRRFS